MHRHQRGGAGRLDRDRRSLQPQRVGEPSGRHAERGPRPGVDVAAQRAQRQLRIVAPADAQVHAGGAPHQRVVTLAGALQCLPGHLEQQPLLGIHGRSLARRNAEETGVEAIHAVQETAPAGVHLPRPPRLGIVDVVDAPPLRRHLADAIHSIPEQRPEGLRAVGSSREAAGHAHDRDRLVRGLLRHRLHRRAGGHILELEDLIEQIPDDLLERRVIEHQGCRERLAHHARQGIAQLDRHEGVQAQLTQRPSQGNVRGRGGSQDLRGLSLHRRSQQLGTLIRRGPAQALDQLRADKHGRALLLATRRHLRQERRKRRGTSRQRRPVDGENGQIRRAADQDALQQRDALLGRDDAHALRGHTPGLLSIQPPGHAFRPGAPVNAHRGDAFIPQRVRQGVEERVGRSVVALSLATHE
ncbi:hypothetical protein DB31_6156 [Hyalangium minutum]|uniref:Uncharacterized protein n=1 Tax=Hyalangium minutum TaxID=394096 RepID=A0A085VTU6_9BACT|nr:hypothetical protein DB31_6156 [Hyalangium minutum]